jgi:hypothetical protein
MSDDERITGTKDEHYDLLSVLYHALQGAETCQRYIEDAKQAGDGELAHYFSEMQMQYRQLAQRGKELLSQRMR